VRKRLRVIVEADGGARGNPGPAGYGALVREAGTGETLLEVAAPIGVATNNVAEYSGLLAGLTAAANLGAVEVEVRMDSKLVIEQMSGRWQIKHPGLRPLAAQAATLVRRFDTVRFTWVPRERNRAADALANAAMDGKSTVDLSGLETALPAVRADGEAHGGTEPEESAGAGRPGLAGEPDLAAGPDLTAGPDLAGSPAGTGAPASWAPRAATSTATRLILIRHAETALTAQRRYSGRGDVPLSARGRVQASAVAARVARLGPIALVVSSPLQRCVRTANAVAAAAGDPASEIDADLIETDFGVWEGLTFGEVRDRWPTEMDRWLASTSVSPPGGESIEQVSGRVRRAVARIIRPDQPRTVVVVSHVTPIKLILRDALGVGDALLYRLYLDPAGISIVDRWPDGGVAVRTVNDTAHLSVRQSAD
jgi:ribonuclease H / adenosylcobalamin/alpha-ribazole phosphatase